MKFECTLCAPREKDLYVCTIKCALARSGEAEAAVAACLPAATDKKKQNNNGKLASFINKISDSVNKMDNLNLILDEDVDVQEDINMDMSMDLENVTLNMQAEEVPQQEKNQEKDGEKGQTRQEDMAGQDATKENPSEVLTHQVKVKEQEAETLPEKDKAEARLHEAAETNQEDPSDASNAGIITKESQRQCQGEQLSARVKEEDFATKIAHQEEIQSEGKDKETSSQSKNACASISAATATTEKKSKVILVVVNKDKDKQQQLQAQQQKQLKSQVQKVPSKPQNSQNVPQSTLPSQKPDSTENARKKSSWASDHDYAFVPPKIAKVESFATSAKSVSTPGPTKAIPDDSNTVQTRLPQGNLNPVVTLRRCNEAEEKLKSIRPESVEQMQKIVLSICKGNYIKMRQMMRNLNSRQCKVITCRRPYPINTKFHSLPSKMAKVM